MVEISPLRINCRPKQGDVCDIINDSIQSLMVVCCLSIFLRKSVAAISEELGGVFALCLIMVCVSCFFMIMNVAMKLRDNYYRLTAVGLGTLYALQVFLTIGGVIKFIPSTGVTLPLVSYGGSSLLSTMIVFGIIQGLYIMQFDGRTQKKEQKRRRGRKE